jgi:hypothetical protein
MKSIREATTTIRSIMFQGFLMYGGKPFYLNVELLNKNPYAIILIQASIVKSTVKQLSKYPTNKMISDSGLLKGVLITRVTELIKIRVKILLSNSFAQRFTFFSGAFLIIVFVLIIVLVARLYYLALPPSFPSPSCFEDGFKLSNYDSFFSLLPTDLTFLSLFFVCYSIMFILSSYLICSVSSILPILF